MGTLFNSAWKRVLSLVAPGAFGVGALYIPPWLVGPPLIVAMSLVIGLGLDWAFTGTDVKIWIKSKRRKPDWSILFGHVQSSFVTLFGPNHLGPRSMLVSAIVSLISLFILFIVHWLAEGCPVCLPQTRSWAVAAAMVVIMTLAAVLVDYVNLFKVRTFLESFIRHRNRFAFAWVFIVLDATFLFFLYALLAFINVSVNYILGKYLNSHFRDNIKRMSIDLSDGSLTDSFREYFEVTVAMFRGASTGSWFSIAEPGGTFLYSLFVPSLWIIGVISALLVAKWYRFEELYFKCLKTGRFVNSHPYSYVTTSFGLLCAILFELGYGIYRLGSG